ncbi:hypothetical protein [Actinomadura sp. WAC 06369]|uniref:hypothetical protein n=1 Tax=Actinomadura sp. WAC 06369 TaxID=2203193 RepID=UPI000F777F33|nr:hypothetical protein [Actinomadura sp. WAC 06369]RSN60268.1 hypothetical protein DMH08_20910 [Actinomadura sp. WAC 06369]
MPKIVDYARFADRLAAPRDRWDLLREVQDEWGYEPPADGPVWLKWDEAEHAAYVRHLRGELTGEDADRFAGVDPALPVPKALDEWWELPFNSFTRSPRLYWTHPEYPPTVRPDPSGHGVAGGLPAGNPFVGPGDDVRVCVFMAEYEYCNEWGYLAAEAGQDDPRVLVTVDDDTWVPQARSISEFFVQLAVQRIPHYRGWLLQMSEDDFAGDAPFIERLQASYRPMGFEPWRELEACTTAYGGPDVIVLHDTGMRDYSVEIAARTRDALVRAAAVLGRDLADGDIRPPKGDAAS